ncbi:MAG: ABC transporter substrate-binding protein [Deinococcales bacterium]
MKRLAIVVAAALLALSGAAWAQTLVYGESGLPVSLDLPQDGNSLTVQYQIAEPLVGFQPGSSELRPLLATSWEANADATQWTFHLREGVTFHDGTPFNAEAVKFNFDRWNHGYLLEKVEALDDTTVRFDLTSPVGFFPALVASSYFGIQSPAAVKAAGVDYGTPGVGAVGTGPFKFQEWVQGDHVTVVRNDAYWGDKAKVERIVFRGIESPATRLAELEAGTLDIAVNLSPDDLQAVESNSDLRRATAEANLSIGYIGFHQANKPFDDLRVRQAVAYAIDQKAIVDAFWSGLGTPAAEFIPPGLIGRAGYDIYPYDPEKAKQLLADAGFPNGFQTEFWYMPVSRPYFPSPKDIAEAVAGYLSEVGIQAELRTEDWGIYLTEYDEGKFPMFMLGWNADYADPNNFIYTFFSPTEIKNGFGWADANADEVVKLLGDARKASSETERVTYYEQADKIIYDQVPAMPVVYPTTLHATRTNIDGFLPNPLGVTSVQLNEVTKN